MKSYLHAFLKLKDNEKNVVLTENRKKNTENFQQKNNYWL